MEEAAGANTRATAKEKTTKTKERKGLFYLCKRDEFPGPGPELLVLDGHGAVLGVALELDPVAQAVTPGHLVGLRSPLGHQYTPTDPPVYHH